MKTPGPRLVISGFPAVLGAAALAAPVLSALGYTLVAFAILQFFSLVCHQDPARSFWIAGAPVAVCTRCLGIYLGGVAGAWITLPRRVILGLLAPAILVSLLDYFAETAGIHGNWPMLRFALGGSLGITIGALVASSLQPSVGPGSSSAAVQLR